MTIKTAAERVAALRDEYARLGENVDHLTDIDLLNQYAEVRERECIDTRDRYMSLLTEQRKNDDQVREAARQSLREHIDIVAVEAVKGRASELDRIMHAVEHLPERADAKRVEGLKQIVADTRHMLRLRDGVNPTQEWRLDDNAVLVRHVRSVINVLGDRDGIPADEVIRLVGEALTPNGNLRDLFDVADRGTLKAHRQPQQPAFAGDGWVETGGYWACEPDGSRFRVVAYALGDTWYLDLQGPTGALIAAGETTEQQVAATATALIEQAPELAASGLRPWQCWQQATLRNVTEIPMRNATQPALFADDDVQTEGYAQPQPRDENTVEDTEPAVIEDAA